MIVRQSNLSFKHWSELASAFERLITSGVMNNIVNDHKMKYMMHGSMWRLTNSKKARIAFERFLPWHRAYLIKLEEQLRLINPDLSIPYWDWWNDKGNLEGITELDSINNGYWSRIVFQHDFLVRIYQTRVILAIEDYYFFSEMLERFPHNAGHIWAGGDMSNVISAPKDPLFWMHHANIDRLWSIWQLSNKGKRSRLKGKNARMQPWGKQFNIKNLNDSEDLGIYSYIYESLNPED